MTSALLPLIVVALAAGPRAELDRRDQLAAALVATAPRYLDDATALEHATAALAAERYGVDAELLLGMAWVESRYQVDSVSRVQDGRRRTGRWRSSRPAGKGPRFCGVVQAKARHSWRRCLELRDIAEGYRAGAAELADWRRICRRMKRRDITRCALDGHGGGVQAARRRTTYGPRVLRRTDRIRGAQPARSPAAPARRERARPPRPAT